MLGLNNKKILLGLTGSVASTLGPKLAQELKCEGAIVKIVITKNVSHFLSMNNFIDAEIDPDHIYGDENEFVSYKRGDPILHIQLRKWADILIIAPLSANTLAKMANGICDNLLTNIVRAWDSNKPMIVAHSMNTAMLENNLTNKHLTEISNIYKSTIIDPTEKELACGDFGLGAMADINDIIEEAENQFSWCFPLKIEQYRGVPIGNHPGSFGFKRFGYMHSGVDLYCEDKSTVFAVEDGIIVSEGQFTGKALGHDWWEDTNYVMVEGKSGVVCYGEIGSNTLIVGNEVKRGNKIAEVKRVLPFGKERPDIAGHNLSMLHIELYENGTKSPVDWRIEDAKPKELFNPTEYLLRSKKWNWLGHSGINHRELI